MYNVFPVIERLFALWFTERFGKQLVKVFRLQRSTGFSDAD